MSPRTHRALLPLLFAVALGLAACATSPSSPGDSPVTPGTSPTDVVGQGTVIQVGDATPEFCLGAVAESYPPQCTGPQLSGWDWTAYEGSEASGDVTWGTYAVFGSWDGDVLTVDSAIMLALYDTIPEVDPLLDEANAGSSSEEQLRSIQDELASTAPVEILVSYIENGYLFAQVVHDDGSVQAWADTTYGPGVVAVRSALKPVDA